ncbi:MAG: hypothetical protein MJ146_01045 [Clostridia bacterium]|nr:hypothetical protein [Clostridia bacterium]
MKESAKLTFKILGTLALIEGSFMVPCVFAAVYYEEYDCAKPFFTCSLLAICFGLVIKGLTKTGHKNVLTRESYLIVILSWLFCILLGMMPLYCSGQDYTFMTSLFESVSAFTTTGCTAINLDIVPKAILLWRSISNWLGGMGILVLLIAIFPMWGISNQSIANAEMPGAKLEKVEASYSTIGKFLYRAYLTFTAIQFVLLYLGPMDAFTALITSFSVISTSGVTITADSAFMFESGYVKAIITAFAFLSSLNYVTFFMMIRGKFKGAFKNIELKIYCMIILVSTLFVTLVLRITGEYQSIIKAFEDAICQVVAFNSTLGFAFTDYTRWPMVCMFVLCFLMICGGCTFSTSGSLKVIRITVLFKVIKRGLMRHIHPNIINAIVVENRAIPAKIVSGIISFSLLFFGMYIILCLLLSFSGYDIETVMTTTLGMLSNTGLAMGIPGTSGSFSMFSGFSKGVMSFAMIAGRLEMYALLILFSKSFWKPNRR